MEKSWYSYKSKSGLILFYYNSETGEHRWTSCFEPPECSKVQSDELPLIKMCQKGHKISRRKKKSYKSIATETEEYFLVKNSKTKSVRNIGTNTDPTCLNSDFQCDLVSQRSCSPPRNPFTTDQPLLKPEEIVDQEFVAAQKESLVHHLFAMELSSVVSSEDDTNLAASYATPGKDGATKITDTSGLQSFSASRDSSRIMDQEGELGKINRTDNRQNKSTLEGCYLNLGVGKEGQIFIKSEFDECLESKTGGTQIKVETSRDDDADDDNDDSKFSIADFLPSRSEVNPVQRNSSRSFQCPKCKREFIKMSRLQRHMIVHSNLKPHACTICSKRFREANCLKKHLRTHTGEKPYNCSVCDRAFSQSQNLAKHMNIHTGNKPHKCKECGKAFSQHSHLARHKLIHTGEKPYRCTKCSKAYRTSSHLLRHVKSSNH